jgi:hypothetical protein
MSIAYAGAILGFSASGPIPSYSRFMNEFATWVGKCQPVVDWLRKRQVRMAALILKPVMNPASLARGVAVRSMKLLMTNGATMPARA